MASEHPRNHLEQEVISTLRPQGRDGAIRTRVTKGTWDHWGRSLHPPPLLSLHWMNPIEQLTKEASEHSLQGPTHLRSNRRRTHTQGLWATEDLQAAKQQNVDTHTVARDPQTDQQLMLLTKHSMSQHASILFEKIGLKCIDFSDLICWNLRHRLSGLVNLFWIQCKLKIKSHF